MLKKELPPITGNRIDFDRDCLPLIAKDPRTPLHVGIADTAVPPSCYGPDLVSAICFGANLHPFASAHIKTARYLATSITRHSHNLIVSVLE